MYGNRGSIPFELLVERLCQKYHQLPKDILEMDLYWFNMFLNIADVDMRKEQKEEREGKIREKANQNGFKYN